MNNKSNEKPKLVVVNNTKPNNDKNNKKQNNKKQNTKKQKPKKSKAKKQKPAKSTKSRLKFINVKNVLLSIVALALIIIIVYIVTGDKISAIGESDKLFSTEFGVNSKADFYVDGKDIFYSTKDTVTLLNSSGENVWSDTFSMVSPAMLADGDFIGVADIKNKVMNVYSKKGKVYSIDTDGNITSFAINPLGASAIICKNTSEGDYNVSVYNSAGEKMFMGSYVISDGIPITVDISDDSSKVAVGFVNTSGISITSNVLFYSTNKAIAAQIENSDAMFSAVSCDKEMVGSVRFLDNDSCIIATDKSLSNIGGKDVAQYVQNWRIDFENYVTAFDVVDSDYVAVAYGESMEGSEDSVEKNSIFWYKASNGSVKGSALMETSVSSLSSGLGCTIAELDDNTFVALKPSGSQLWQYEGVQNISDILFYGDTDTIAVVSATKMTLTDVKKGAANTEVEASDDEENKNGIDTNAAVPEDNVKAQAESEEQAEAETEAQAETEVQTEESADEQEETEAQEQ